MRHYKVNFRAFLEDNFVTHKKRPGRGPGRCGLLISTGLEILVVGQRANYQANDGPCCDGGEHSVATAMIAHPVMSGRRGIEPIGVVIGNIDRVLVRTVPAADMVTRRVAFPVIRAIGAAVSRISMAWRSIMAVRARRGTIGVARCRLVVMPFRVVAFFVVVVVAMAAIVIPAVMIIAVSAISAAMAPIMISTPAMMITATAICIGRWGSEKADRRCGGDQRGKGLEKFHGRLRLRLVALE